jgi:acetyl esterase/lipase
MSKNIWALIIVAVLATAPATAAPVPRAIYTDPVTDPKNPARMEVIHVPSGGVEINGVVYVAAGPGPHPTFVIFHGLPGNEKNLDLAQAVRRAGWNAVTVNYRGSWGSPGTYSFAQNLDDAKATLAYLRIPENAAKLGIDPARIAIGGHSMGGWVTAHTAAADSNLLGAVMISSGDMGRLGAMGAKDRPTLVKWMAEDREALAGVTPESMADEAISKGPDWLLAPLGPKLVNTHLLVLYSKDGLQPDSVGLVNAIKANGGKTIEAKFVPTDHSWSDRRIMLQTLVINWLATLEPPK